MKVLFFDISITGHHSEYISHLVDYLNANQNNGNTYYFVLHPEFSRQFPSIAGKAKGTACINWIEITPTELRACEKGGTIRKSVSAFRLMNKYAVKFSIGHVFLMYFNTFQLALNLFRPSYRISGILFMQFNRMQKDSLSDKIRYYRKSFLTWLYTRNKRIKTIYLLNDEKSVEQLNRKFRTKGMFRMLPDPVPTLQPLANFDVYESYGIDWNRSIFLHAGSLDYRKGTLDILDSIYEIPVEKQLNICLFFAGKAKDHFEQEMKDRIISYRRSSLVQIIWENHFISNEKMKSLFDQSDCILMPYKNSEASSGILGHAIASAKKVIAPDSGLLKEIVEENGLGILLPHVDPKSIAKAIIESDSFSINTDKLAGYIQGHNAKLFSSILISGL